MFFLIVGLGNPGTDYQGSRHNVGFEVVERFATVNRLSWQRQSKMQIAQGKLKTHEICLIKPLTYMNLSGQAVAQAVTVLEIELPNIMVIHDDMDLELGRIQVKKGGGDGGHRGIGSIIEQLDDSGFCRIRLGIGHPEQMDPKDYVLSQFDPTHHETVRIMLQRATEAVTTWIEKGLVTSMNQYNIWPPKSNQTE